MSESWTWDRDKSRKSFHALLDLQRQAKQSGSLILWHSIQEKSSPKVSWFQMWSMANLWRQPPCRLWRLKLYKQAQINSVGLWFSSQRCLQWTTQNCGRVALAERWTLQGPSANRSVNLGTNPFSHLTKVFTRSSSQSNRKHSSRERLSTCWHQARIR